jgi:16S rRNA (guanine527-N7)-methyltransferase
VKQRVNLKGLVGFLYGQGIYLTKDQVNLFEEYLGLIRSWSNRVNLVSRHDIDDMVERHILPCLLLYTMIQPGERKRILDIGSGAGFPGIIFKIVQSDLQIDLIDSAKKKYLFLIEANESLSIKCNVHNQRVETLGNQKGEKFDCVVSRGVADMQTLWSWSRDLIKPKGILFTLKGGRHEEEMELLINKGIKAEILRPSTSWIKFSHYLNDKFVIKAERADV